MRIYVVLYRMVITMTISNVFEAFLIVLASTQETGSMFVAYRTNQKGIQRNTNAIYSACTRLSGYNLAITY